MQFFQKTQEVQDHVKQNAIRFGNKAANLMELDFLCRSIKNNQIRIQIPDILPIDDATIKSHLDTYAKEWRQLWDEFVKEQTAKKTLTEQAIKKLKKLQSLVVNCFHHHPITINGMASLGLDPNTLFMVRSTGEEDTVDIANPGGNKSVAAVKLDKNAISDAIGIVVASYLSEKSLTQRLLSHDCIVKTPFMPVLMQKMIGEKLNGETLDKIVVSGVMYATGVITRIEAAPGHGELIVNSKAPFDTFDVTADDIVHAEIHHKDMRMIPVEVISKNQTTNKRKLIFTNNPKRLQYRASFAEDIALNIAKVGRAVAQHYGMPMDIEFVYQPNNKILYLVQARPIPQVLNQRIKPSAITPIHWLEIKKRSDIEKLKVNVVSTAGNAAKVMTDPKQVRFDVRIASALKFYLAHPEIQEDINAVMIKDNAPSNSHEAAQFNAMGIPVIQTADFSRAENWLKQNAPVLIVDPQRQHVINWSKQIKDQTKAERELIDTKVIAEGLYSSALSAKKTLLPIKLMPNKIIQQALKKYLDGKKEKINTKIIYSQLLQCFDEIEAAKPQDKNEDAFAALRKVAEIFKKIGTSTRAKEKRSAHQLLFVHAMLSVAEIDHCLETYSALGADNEIKARQQLLDLVSKLKALVINPGEEGLYSDSILQIAAQNKLLNSIANINENLNVDQQSYFQEFIKLNKLAWQSDTKNQWTQFALNCSKQSFSRQLLAKIIFFSHDYHLQSELINQLFVRHYQEATEQKYAHFYESILTGIFTDICENELVLKSCQLKNNNVLMKSWENKINEWSNPDKFDRLFSEFEHDMVLLIDRLSITDTMPVLSKKAVLKQVQQLAEVIDKTIKSMKGSPQYSNEQTPLVVDRFIKLLNLYHLLMNKWMNAIPEAHYKKWAALLTKTLEYNSKSGMINEIAHVFKTKKEGPKEVKQLHPSGFLAVSATRVGTTASFRRQFVRNENYVTLEDLFSLMHQNILACTVILGKETEIGVERLPEQLQILLHVLAENKKIDLLGMTHEHPHIILEYNIPLHNHSAKLLIDYDLEKHTLVMQGNFFGSNRHNRMGMIGDIAAIEGRLLHGNLPNPPVYDQQGMMLEFSWQFKAEQINELAKYLNNIINDYAVMTKTYSEIEVYKKLLKRHLKADVSDKLLEALSPDLVKKIKELGKEDNVKLDSIQSLLEKNAAKNAMVDQDKVMQVEVPNAFSRQQNPLAIHGIFTGKEKANEKRFDDITTFLPLYEPSKI